jgi:hypothetical protein
MKDDWFNLDRPSESQMLVKIMSRLDKERRLRFLRRRLVLTVMVFIPLLAVVGPVWHYFWLDFQSSGLIDYLSLATSDAAVVLANWQNFGLGLLEFFPVISTASILGVLLAWLIVIKLAFEYSQEFMNFKQISKLQKI